MWTGFQITYGNGLVKLYEIFFFFLPSHLIIMNIFQMDIMHINWILALSLKKALIVCLQKNLIVQKDD